MEKKCAHADCKTTCNHKVDLDSLQKSKDQKNKIVDGNKIVKK
jgi:hypothetical protein